MAIYEPGSGSGFSPDTRSAVALILHFPALRLVEIDHLYCIGQLGLWYLLYNSLNALRHPVRLKDSEVKHSKGLWEEPGRNMFVALSHIPKILSNSL